MAAGWKKVGVVDFSMPKDQEICIELALLGPRLMPP